jgi:hypothetical protein
MTDKQQLTVHKYAVEGRPQNLPTAFNFEQIERMATAFAKSGLFGVKEQSQALALMFYAQAMGKHPALIMRDYDVIQGRLAKKSEVMLRDYQASGGSVEWTKYGDDGVTGIFRHPLAPRPLEIKWDLERATKAGLAGKDGGMYKKYPAAMFRSRCISEGVRGTAPDVTEQMYTPEEIRSIEQEEEPVTTTVAVTQVAEQSRNALPPEEVEELMRSLEVPTLAELTGAWAKAYTRTKEAKDVSAKNKLEARYHERKDEIAAEAAREAEAERAAISGEGVQS